MSTAGDAALSHMPSPDMSQGLLFEDGLNVLDQSKGYRGPVACKVAGITYRQLDYWARTGLVQPSVRDAKGSGSQRLYGFRDIIALKVVRDLLTTGVSLQQIRVAVDHLRSRGVDDLSQLTLMSDGATIYECHSADEISDLVLGGHGVFGIALGRVLRDVECTLSELPQDRDEDDASIIADGHDELSRRRRERMIG